MSKRTCIKYPHLVTFLLVPQLVSCTGCVLIFAKPSGRVKQKTLRSASASAHVPARCHLTPGNRYVWRSMWKQSPWVAHYGRPFAGGLAQRFPRESKCSGGAGVTPVLLKPQLASNACTEMPRNSQSLRMTSSIKLFGQLAPAVMPMVILPGGSQFGVSTSFFLC